MNIFYAYSFNLFVKLINLISITFTFVLLLDVIALHSINTHVLPERFTKGSESQIIFWDISEYVTICYIFSELFFPHCLRKKVE